MFEAPIFENENDRLAFNREKRAIKDYRTTVHCLSRYWNDLGDQRSEFLRKLRKGKEESVFDYFERFKETISEEDYRIEKHREVALNMDRLSSRFFNSSSRIISLPHLFKYQIQSLCDAFVMWEKTHIHQVGMKTNSTHALDPEHSYTDIVHIKEILEDAIENGIGNDLPIILHPRDIAAEYYQIEKARKLHEMNINRFNASGERIRDDIPDLDAVDAYEILKHLVWTPQKETMLRCLCRKYNQLIINKEVSIIEKGWLYELIQVVTFIPITDWKYWKNDDFDYESVKGDCIYFGYKNELPNNHLPTLFELALIEKYASDESYTRDKNELMHCIKIMLNMCH